MQRHSPDGEPLRSSFGTVQPLIQGRIILFSSATGPVRKIHKFHHNVLGALRWGWGGTNLFQGVLSSFQSQAHKCFECQWWNDTLVEITPKIHKRYTAPDIWEIRKPPLSWPPSPSRCNDHPRGFPGSGCVSTSRSLQHIQTHVCPSKDFESSLRVEVWGSRACGCATLRGRQYC